MNLRLVFILVLVPFLGFAQNFKMESKDSLNGKPKNGIVFSGYVNTIYNYDFVGTSSQYPALNIVSIPVGNVLKEPSTSFVIFQTRLRFKSEHQTKIGTVKVYVEADFINSANAFRIRHALISVKKWDFGQTWSNFSDEDAWPNMTDYDGPPTGIWARPTMIRYNAIQGKRNSLSFSVEGPSLEYDTHHDLDTIVSTAHQDIPDFTVRYRYNTEKFHFQIGAVLRNIKYKNNLDSSFNYEQGYGISASTGITIFKRDHLHAQATIGKGISRYLVGFEGYNWDAVPTGNGKLELVPAIGGFIGYDHYWDKAKKFSSTAVFGYIKIKNDALPIFPGDFMTGYWGLVNFYYHPIDNLDFAIEYVTAKREDALEQTGTGARFQFLVQYAF
ncbi:MAG: hypothetical protein KAG64_03260 [Bacteroidales bacterium]|nr:hypothetical protein [Bacteroidales bacterium]